LHMGRAWSSPLSTPAHTNLWSSKAPLGKKACSQYIQEKCFVI
jgi:hypothetical protein